MEKYTLVQHQEERNGCAPEIQIIPDWQTGEAEKLGWKVVGTIESELPGYELTCGISTRWQQKAEKLFKALSSISNMTEIFDEEWLYTK